MINLLDELLAVCGALVGGAKYGLKIRLPHALVMTMLFRRGTDNAIYLDSGKREILILLLFLLQFSRLELQGKDSEHP